MTRDMTASVHQRLLNYARATDRPFNQVLQYFTLERFLYRLGHSPHSRRFVPKGALMFVVWRASSIRPTRDIDLLGYLDNAVEHVAAVIGEICREPVPEDGLFFDAESIAVQRIIEAADYAGVRVRFTAYLGTARIPMQIDVGFGDPIVPGPILVRLPTILDLPGPELQGYSRESMVAEKLQSMVRLGIVNSRMKDFYDVWVLSGSFEFDGLTLSQAIRETFRRRQTVIPLRPTAFGDVFALDHEKQAQWTAFIDRLGQADAPVTLHKVVGDIAAFLRPVLDALIAESSFERRWSPGGPWMQR